MTGFDFSDVDDEFSDATPPCPRGHTEGAYHDCAYVESVNRLIPEAERCARVRFNVLEESGMPDDPEALLSKLFHQEMQVACEVAGLRKPKPRRGESWI
jgi:hypothetical protein